MFWSVRENLDVVQHGARKLHPVRLFCIFRDPRVKQRFAAQIEADVGECIAPAGMGQVEFSAAAGDPADAGNAFEPVVSGRGERQKPCKSNSDTSGKSPFATVKS